MRASTARQPSNTRSSVDYGAPQTPLSQYIPASQVSTPPVLFMIEQVTQHHRACPPATGYSGGYDPGMPPARFTASGDYDYADYPDEGADYGNYGGVGQPDYEFS